MYEADPGRDTIILDTKKDLADERVDQGADFSNSQSENLDFESSSPTSRPQEGRYSDGSDSDKASTPNDTMSASVERLLNGHSAASSSQLSVSDDDLIPFAQLPWTKVTSEVSPADIPLELVEVWVVDVLSRMVPVIYEWLRKFRDAAGLDQLFAHHLKHLRKKDSNSVTILVAPLTFDIALLRARLKEEVELQSDLYTIPVPMRHAVNRQQFFEFSQHWPVQYLPLRVGPRSEMLPLGWSRDRVEWAQEMVDRLLALVDSQAPAEDLPIASLVTSKLLGSVLAESRDCRRSTGKSLCHASMRIIEMVADMDLVDARLLPDQPAPYLLGNLHYFTTHEPCVMCSMALLHSRVAAVYYIQKSPGSGGLGSLYSVHEDKGLNHRFEVWHWQTGTNRVQQVECDP